MLILTLRTDKPEAEIGLYEDTQQLAYETWHAHRQLAETLHARIEALLKAKGKLLEDIDGIVAYQGPGSFTGLRIGLSVANALSYSLGAPVVAYGGNWIEEGIGVLRSGKNGQIALPDYGGDVHITPSRK